VGGGQNDFLKQTSVDEFDSFCESQLPDADANDADADGGGVDGLSKDLSSLFSEALRTAPTRSLAIRDHDSNRLWANQHAAGPNPLILIFVPKIKKLKSYF
jgi:hypothetical protein